MAEKEIKTVTVAVKTTIKKLWQEGEGVRIGARRDEPL